MAYSPELNDSMAEFLVSLREEYTLYCDVLAIARKERDAIAEMNMTHIRTLIHEKEELLERAEKIENRIGDLRTVWLEAKDLIQPALSHDIESFLKTFSALMKELLAYQDENEQLFIQKNNIKEKELSTVRQARRAQKAYFEQGHKGVARNTDRLG